MNKKQSGFGAVEVILIVIIIILIGALGWTFWNNSKDSDKTDEATTSETQPEVKSDEPIALEKGTFSASKEAGTVQVEGYASIDKMNQDLRCEDNCKTNDYVFFNITRTENQDILQYIKDLDGNTFAGKKSIGLGCVEDGVLSYYNVSDKNGSKEYKLSEDDTSKIIDSTSDKPVALQLEKLKSTGGSEAPSLCYSHMTKIELL